MDKHIYDETTNIRYTMQGQYYLPDLTLSEEEHPIGIWGQRHLRYLKQYRKVLYYNLLTSGRLNSFLADVNVQAEEMFSQIMNRMAEQEDVNEQHKANHPMEWIARMNSICSRAEEIVNKELVYV